jgi:hypothetical protein
MFTAEAGKWTLEALFGGLLVVVVIMPLIISLACRVAMGCIAQRRARFHRVSNPTGVSTLVSSELPCLERDRVLAAAARIDPMLLRLSELELQVGQWSMGLSESGNPSLPR